MDFIGIKKVMLALGAVATVVIFFRQAGTMAALIHPPTMLLLGWCLLPMAHLGMFGREDDRRIVHLLLLAATAVAVVSGIWVYVDVLVLRVHASSPIAFMVVPLMQMAVVVLAIGAAWQIRRRARAAPAGASP